MTEIIKTYNPDSFIGYMASTLYGSSETTFYVIAVYFGAVGIKRTRHTIPACLTADLFGILAAVLIVNLLFR
jgi:spore maturation protein B